MGLFSSNIKFLDNLPTSFEDDNFILTSEMTEKYKKSRIKMEKGQVKPRKQRFCKNASIFDITGKKITWGDIAPEDVNEMMGVYYILSEEKSLWNKNEIKENSRDHSPDLEGFVFNIDYIKRKAFARIIDGEIQTNETLIKKRIEYEKNNA